MIEPQGGCQQWQDGWEDAEALVRAAGDYVRPSDDLRPRVLETARAESHERWAQRRIWQVALAVALLGLCSTSFHGRLTKSAARSAGGLQAAAIAPHIEAGHDGWSMVDSFTDLRRRHAAMLRLTP